MVKPNRHTEQTVAQTGRTLLPSLAKALVMLTCGAQFFIPSPVAAFYHDLEKNKQPCNDCHTLHYSEGGSQPAGTEAGGPFADTLVRSTTNKLCLFCHDGSDPNAPDVLDFVTMYQGSGDEYSGAGFFANSGTANPNGHDLGGNALIVPFSSLTNVTLSCASCHDPHGTANYRNVLTAPGGGTGVAVLMAQDVFRDLPPGTPPSAVASIGAYKKSNEGYKANTSLWCTQCHDLLQPSVNTPQNRAHHFVNVPLNREGYPTDFLHWVGGTGVGFGDVTGDALEGIPRLRFQVSRALDFMSAKEVAANNEVICGSCHFAHGGPHQKGLVWPHLETDSTADADSGCQQCHNR